MKNKEKKPMSIKWKLFLFLAVFVGLIIALLWVLQVVFLDDFYKTIKVNEIQNVSQSIRNHISDDDAADWIDSLSTEHSISVIVAQEDGTVLYQAADRNGSMLFRVSGSQFYEWMTRAKQNNGVYTQIFQELTVDALPDIGGQVGQGGNPNMRDPMLFGRGNDDKQSILHASVVTFEDGTEGVILLNTDITPMDATVQTIQTQLILITVILLLGALLLAFLISIMISRPITKINDASKELAKGNYQVAFAGGGYKEIQELSHTLNYAKEELSHLDDYRRDLLANVSHDLRTPLTLITGYAEMMRDLPGENNEENAQTIIDEANRLTGLVNDVLELSKFESNTQTLNLQQFDLTESIQSMVDRMAKMTLLQGYEISFVGGEQHVTVNADAMKISQVVYNLVSNAITHTGENRKVIVRQTVEDNVARISVIDFGEGIAKENLPKIWERYYKVDKEHKRAQVGTGLGLSIVKSIFDLHNMRYGVTSEIGKGSTFWFELPCTF